MLLSIGYTVFLGLFLFGIMRYINLKKEVGFSKFQLVSGFINLFISLIFLFIYFSSTDLLDTTIDNSIVFWYLLSWFPIFIFF